MSYRYPYNGPSFPQDSMSPTTPGGGSNASTPVLAPVNNPWDFEYDVATSAPNQLQPQDPNTSTGITTLHPADFSSPQEQFSASATPAVSSPTVIQLEERVPVVPSQYHRSRLRTPSGESRPRTHVQKDTSSAGAEQPTCTNTGSAPSSGLVRGSPTKAHAERARAHPYRRPHSAGEGRAATHFSNTAEASKTRRSVSDQARVSPFTEDNRSGLTRMRYAAPQTLPPLILSSPLRSNAHAGPAVHRKPCRSIAQRLLPKFTQFVPIFISTSTRTLWSPCSNCPAFSKAKSP
jgi:hypothetical protein